MQKGSFFTSKLYAAIVPMTRMRTGDRRQQLVAYS